MSESSATTVPVAGLACVCCAEDLEQRVKQLPGVRRASVNLPEGELRVLFDAARVDDAAIRAAVSKAGYRCRDEHPDRTTGELVHELEMQPITCCTTILTRSPGGTVAIVSALADGVCFRVTALRVCVSMPT